MARFADKVAVITGGGAGIGRSVATRLASEGASIIVIDIDQIGATDTVEAIQAIGGRAEMFEIDVSQENEMQRVVSTIVARWGRIDVLHNNAAVMSSTPPDGDIAELDVGAWDHKMAVNLRGPMLGCKFVVPVMREHGSGSIVNTASVSGLIGTDGNAAYSASKAALISLTRSVATMAGADGIRCNAVAPGLVLTEHLDAALATQQRDLYAAERLLPWAATPDDVAATIAWLASDEARGVTGQTIVVDSGTTAQRPRHAIATWLKSHGT